MGKMEPLISELESCLIFEIQSLNKRDIERLSPISKPSIKSYFDDVGKFEKYILYRLELKNIILLLRSILVGLGDRDIVLKKLPKIYSYALDPITEMAENSSVDNDEKAKRNLIYLATYIMAKGDADDLTPKLRSGYPNKLSFIKQDKHDTIDKWFVETSRHYITTTMMVLDRSNKSLARFYILPAIAWYLNDLEPHKFYSKYKELNLKIYSILKKVGFHKIFDEVMRDLYCNK